MKKHEAIFASREEIQPVTISVKTGEENPELFHVYGADTATVLEQIIALFSTGTRKRKYSRRLEDSPNGHARLEGPRKLRGRPKGIRNVENNDAVEKE